LATLGLGFGISVFPSVYVKTEASEVPEEQDAHKLLIIGTVDFMGFRAKEVTPNNEFYITTYSTEVPEVGIASYRLRIEGLVANPSSLAMKDLEAMQDKKEFVTLECIGNPVGGGAIGNALWEGVTLRKVLDAARPSQGILKAAFFSRDGYSDSIPYALARSDDVFLAWKMNGEPLPKNHGYPLRAIVPGIYGMKHVKWLSKIELVNYNFKGFWEKKGWSDDAVIPVKSQILMPMSGKSVPTDHYLIGGVAFGGRHGINRVQISLDKGRTWRDANVKAPLSRWAWSLWQFDWKPSRKGAYAIRVRGIDKAGTVQESTSLIGRLTGSFPAGSKGVHQVDVTVM
jgi:DMSO/TMAO reductase YedYZ molybdopterin-dependent catalytic subunit